eukprot:gene31660-6858_t
MQLEIRPFGMPSRWASRYFFQQLRQEGQVHLYGINVYNRENSVAPPMEEVLSPLLNSKGEFSGVPNGGSPQPATEPQGGDEGAQC